MDETQPHGEDFNKHSLLMAAFQLSIIPTAAQRLQIAIHQCSRGVLGSGSYFNSSEEAMESALKHLRYFHRHIPLNYRFKTIPSNYTFRFITVKS